MNPNQEPRQDETPQLDEPTPTWQPQENAPASTPAETAPTETPNVEQPVSPGAPVSTPVGMNDQYTAAPDSTSMPTPSSEPMPSEQSVTMTQPAAQPSAENPGKTLGIISIVLDVLGAGLIGLILGIISRKKSKQAGQPTTLGTIGMVLGIISTVITLAIFLLILLAVPKLQEVAEKTATDSGSAPSTSINQGGSSPTLTLADDARTVTKHAEAYNAINGDYPKTLSDFDKQAESKLPSDLKVYGSLLSNRAVTYIYCSAGAAQVIYLGDTKTDLRITPLGTASATESCR